MVTQILIRKLKRLEVGFQILPYEQYYRFRDEPDIDFVEYPAGQISG